MLGPHSLRSSRQRPGADHPCTAQLAPVTSELSAPIGLDATTPAHDLLGNEQLTLPRRVARGGIF